MRYQVLLAADRDTIVLSKYSGEDIAAMGWVVLGEFEADSDEEASEKFVEEYASDDEDDEDDGDLYNDSYPFEDYDDDPFID